jgi:hypothetical protein
MPRAPRTLPRTLGQLALALLNATLLLALALAIAGIVLIGRVQSFAADTARAAATAIGPDLQLRIDAGLGTVTGALDRLDSLDARLAAAAAAADSLRAQQLQPLRDEVANLTDEVARLNAGLADLRAAADGGLRDTLRRALSEATRSLDTTPSAD